MGTRGSLQITGKQEKTGLPGATPTVTQPLTNSSCSTSAAAGSQLAQRSHFRAHTIRACSCPGAAAVPSLRGKPSRALGMSGAEERAKAPGLGGMI